MLGTKGTSFDGKRCVVSISDGYIVDGRGLDLDLIQEVRRGMISDYVKLRGDGYHCVKGRSIRAVVSDLALLCATQNELTGGNSKVLVKSNGIAVAEGANMACTPEAVHRFHDAGVLFAPGKAANAGGGCSALEMQ